MIITPLKFPDIDAVLAIEQASFHDPFSREMFESELSQKAARIFVAKHEGHIVGYINFWIVLNEIHLINLAVHPDFRRQKIATELFEFMIRCVEARHALPLQIYLEVRPSNLPARKFYEKKGFRVIGTRKRYYRDGEDAVVMAWKKN